MHLRSALLITHQRGGLLRIDAEANPGPVIIATLPGSDTAANWKVSDLESFDTVYQSLEKWQNEMMEAE